MSRKIIALLLALVLSKAVMAAAVDGVMLRYMVSEPGLQPYPSRVIVTPGFIRMDDGDTAGDYLLFDRKQQLISSVTHEDETVLEIPLREVTMPSPVEIKRHHTLERDDKAPKVDGKPPQQLRLYVNDRLCYEATVVPGLLPDVVAALRSFHRVLAGEQGKMVAELPVEQIDGCDLALHTYHPEWSLASGLAIQSFDAALRQGQLLVDIDQTFRADEKLFQLPDNYRRYHTPE